MHLIALDFSKAFDSVKHSTLAEKKIAELPIKDNIYNWIVNFCGTCPVEAQLHHPSS